MSVWLLSLVSRSPNHPPTPPLSSPRSGRRAEGPTSGRLLDTNLPNPNARPPSNPFEPGEVGTLPAMGGDPGLPHPQGWERPTSAQANQSPQPGYRGVPVKPAPLSEIGPGEPTLTPRSQAGPGVPRDTTREKSEKPFRNTDPPAVRSGKVKRKPSHRPQRSMSVVVFHTPPDKR